MITILLMAVMCLQMSGVADVKPVKQLVMQEQDDKDPNTYSPKKETKEFLLYDAAIHAHSVLCMPFRTPSTVLATSPVIDHLTPPPDNIFLV